MGDIVEETDAALAALIFKEGYAAEEEDLWVDVVDWKMCESEEVKHPQKKTGR